VRHRRDTQVRGRHRAAGLPRHRAPRTPLVTDRGRSTAMAAALIAGVGVAGISAAAAGGSPQGTVDTADAAMNALAAPGATPLPSVEIVAATPAATPGPSTTARDRFTAALAADKVRTTPSPVPPPVWVHPMPEAAVTSCFGPRWGRLHAGVDLAAPSGTPIHAAGAGTVVRAGAWADGYGISVLIDHGNGYLTHYAHMSATVIQPGEQVQAGQEIGLEGSTGHSTGPHLHFEVHQGVWKNTVEPTAWLHAHGVDIAGCAALP
jgi:murein DD-endopeptidase MepM/ murein hydrolase activator NlpD